MQWIHDLPTPHVIPPDFRDTGLAAWRRNTVRVAQFQVMGERASATNFLRKLVETNLDIDRTEGLGWKHAAPHMVAIPRSVLCLVIVRNAESWANSMHARPWHADPSLQTLKFSKFIRSPWRGIVDRVSDFEEVHSEIADHVEGEMLQFDRHPITGLPFSNLFEMRNVRLASHLGMINRDCNVALIRAETATSDPEAVIDFLSDEFGIARAVDRFKPVNKRLGNRFNPTGRDAATPRTGMGFRDRSFMRYMLDLEQESSLGYDYVTPLGDHPGGSVHARL